MSAVKVKENEPFELSLRRFKRSCEKAGVLAEVRSREFYEKPTSERKRKAAAAVSVTPRKFSANSAAPYVCTNTQTFVASFCQARPSSRAYGICGKRSMLHRQSRRRDRDNLLHRVRPGSFASGARLF